MTIDLAELEQRGDEDFDSLSDIEKDLYCLHTLDSLSQMEGFESFFVTDRNEHVPRIIMFLKAADSPNVKPVEELWNWIGSALGDWDPEKLDEFLFREENDERLESLGESFSDGTQAMWQDVRAYLKKAHGIRIE